MVKKYFIDCEKLCEPESAQKYLEKTLEFPKYYGKNLDALFDCLTEKGECSIQFKGAEEFYRSNAYGAKVLRVMRDAAEANPLLKMSRAEDEVSEEEPLQK